MRYRAIFFDLDGTLLDTLEDLVYSFDYACTQFGCQSEPEEEYKRLIGKGPKNVIQSIFLKNSINDDTTVTQCLKLYRDIYAKSRFKNTAPYKGIMDLLLFLVSLKIKLVVFSNKPHIDTQKCVSHFFPSIPFEAVIGHRNSKPLKPHPEVTKQLLHEIGVLGEEALMIGDSTIDIQTGKNATMATLAVTWGYGEIKQLYRAQPDIILDTPDQLRSFFQQRQ